MPTNIKVDRLLLIKALETEQKKQTEQFKKDMEKFRVAEKTYPAKLATLLEKTAKQLRRGGMPERFRRAYRNNGYVDIPDVVDLPERPTKPSRNGSICTLQRQIKTLKMATADSITVNENSEYVKFICEI